MLINFQYLGNTLNYTQTVLSALHMKHKKGKFSAQKYS